mgnify:CR=1 FL=1
MFKKNAFSLPTLQQILRFWYNNVVELQKQCSHTKEELQKVEVEQIKTEVKTNKRKGPATDVKIVYLNPTSEIQKIIPVTSKKYVVQKKG